MSAMNETKKKTLLYSLAAISVLLSSFFMYDFYKCLSGFIANGFRDPDIMLPMVFSYFLPVFCCFIFIYRTFVKPMARGIDLALSLFILLYATLCLVFLFQSFPLYISNSTLGVYSTLPGLPIPFPYDAIVFHFCLIGWHVFRLALLCLPESAAARRLDGLQQRGTLRLCVAEYLLLCVLAVLAFVFTGAGITAVFTSLSNMREDPSFLLLLIWVAVIPMMNLLLLACKPERACIPRKKKTLLLSSAIGVNALFALSLLLLFLVHPDFMVHVGKPLFLIAFSVSLPIEMAVIYSIMTLGSLAFLWKLIRLYKPQNVNNC